MSNLRILKICCLLFSILLAPGSVALSHAVDSSGDNGKAMTGELEQFTRYLKEFKSGKSLNLLEKAMRAAEHLSRLNREDEVRMWLQLIIVAERNVDRKFDPNDFPQMSVVPPREESGVRLHSGCKPEAIRDPKARAEYEDALRKNKEKAERFNFQTRLRSLCDHINHDAESRFKRLYTSSVADQEKLDHLLEEFGVSETRRQKLKALFNKGQVK